MAPAQLNERPRQGASHKRWPADTFPLERLPWVVLRNLWDVSLPTKPRVVTIQTHPKARLFPPNRTSLWPNELRLLQIRAAPRGKITFSSRHQGSLFHASPDFRRHLLRQIPSIFREDSEHGLINANLALDTIHFGPHFEIWQIEAFAFAIGEEKAALIQTLALECESVNIFSAYMMYRAWKICKFFENLKKLILIPYQEEDEDSDRYGAEELKIIKRKDHWRYYKVRPHGSDRVNMREKQTVEEIEQFCQSLLQRDRREDETIPQVVRDMTDWKGPEIIIRRIVSENYSKEDDEDGDGSYEEYQMYGDEEDERDKDEDGENEEEEDTEEAGNMDRLAKRHKS